jgi:hypothetical protein
MLPENDFPAETGFQQDSQRPHVQQGVFTQTMENGHDHDHFHRGWHLLLV